MRGFEEGGYELRRCRLWEYEWRGYELEGYELEGFELRRYEVSRVIVFS